MVYHPVLRSFGIVFQPDCILLGLYSVEAHPIQKFLEGCHFPPAYHRRCGIGIFMEIHLSECICAVWTGHRAFLVFPKLVYDSGVVLYRSGHRIYLDALRLSDADLQCGLCLNTRRFTGGGDRRRGVTAAGA